MDKIIDALTKYLPGPVLGAFLIVGLAFFGVHYWRGFRDYGDTLRDGSFLSATILIVAGLCLYLVNERTSPISSEAPLILLPLFENDERDQYRTAFATQLEQALEAGGSKRPVYAVPAFLAERESAIQSARRYGARAAPFHPVIIRGENAVKICFHIAFTESDTTRPYAMVPVEIPTNTLADMANSVLATTLSAKSPGQANPLLARLDSLERQVESLRGALDRAAARALPTRDPYPYRHKRAIVVGVNRLRDAGFSLAYAESDARRFSDVIEHEFGFEVTTLLGEAATKGRVVEALKTIQAASSDDDMVLFYYAGNSLAEAPPGGGDRRLLLFFGDSTPDDQESALDINALTKELQKTTARHTLAVLDGCHGTSGPREPPDSIGAAAQGNPASPVLQVFAASGNDEYAMESADLGGGAFTQSLIHVLTEAPTAGQGVWMHDVVAKTAALMRGSRRLQQTPKLVTVSGAGEIYWSMTRPPDR